MVHGLIGTEVALMGKLTSKQKIFVNEYLVDLNATRVYKIVYPRRKKDETAAQAGSRLLRNVRVKDYIDNTIQGYTAALGKYAVNAIDTILGVKNEKPASFLQQIPGLKEFLVNPYSQQRTIEDFYSLKSDIYSKYQEAVKKFKAENPDIEYNDWLRALKNNITPIKNPKEEVISLPDELSKLHKQQYQYNFEE
ncbi:hypothetical protein CKR_0046 [Clostridium kluyveri NBRC 12016]|nr:hypothetical protein CKR_0046 [Clostridium kluyveri NBRC 12016]